MTSLRTLIIGHGAIAKAVIARLPAHAPGASLVGVLLRPERVAAARDLLPSIPVVGTLDEALALDPDIILECAGHQAVRDYGASCLAAGRDFVVASVGALADGELLARLVAAARASGAQLVIPSGAIGSMDALSAACVGGLNRVTYLSRKPPRAWKGTAAETVCALDSVREPTLLFEGDAARAAATYPQNANVAATIALAGLGMAATEVRLVADPTVDGNVHTIQAEGAFGAYEMVVRGKPMPDNPKTSALTAMSLVRVVAARCSPLVIA